MKLFKIVLYALLTLVLMGSASAIVADNTLQGWWQLNSSFNDSSGFNKTLEDPSPTPFTSTGCHIDNCSDFTPNDFLDSNFTESAVNDPFTWNFWFDMDSVSGAHGLIVSLDQSTTFNGIWVALSGSSSWIVRAYDTGAVINLDTTQAVTVNTKHMFTLTYDGTRLFWYLDGIHMNNNTGNIDNTIESVLFGAYRKDDTTSNMLDGQMDEISYWNTSFSAANVTDIFNNDITFTPAVPPTPEIQNDVQALYNTSNISIQLNTTSNVNMSYSLDNASLVSICNDCNNSVLNLTSLTDGLHNIIFNAVDENGESNVSENFTIDTTNPNLNVSLPSEINSYFINFSSFINVSDLNLSSCTVFVSNDFNTTCTNESYEFQSNGNHTINVTAIDTVGNQNSSLNNLILVNPVQFFSFNNLTGGPINNYTFGGVLFNNTVANISTYNDIISLGNNTLLFEKLGFASTNVTFNLNTTSRINLTTNITGSVILLRIFDRETGSLVTGLTSITLIAGLGFNGTTTTGLLNISNINFVSGAYQIIAENANYSTESIFFTYNNQESLTKDIFMLKNNATDAGTVTVQVTASTGPFVQGAVCQALEWKPAQSAFVSVAEGNTNTEGSTILNIEIGTKLYKFTCSKDGVSVTSPQNIIQVSGATIPLVLDIGEAAPVTLLSNFIFTLTNATLNETHQQITYTFNSQDNLVTEACLRLFKINGNVRSLLEPETCVSSSSGEIQIIVDINQTFSQKVVATAEEGGVSRDVDELNFLGEFSFETSLSAYGMHILVPLLFLVVTLVLGLMIKPSNIHISLFAMLAGSWFTYKLVPGVMSLTSTIFINVVLLLMLWGSFRR